MKCRQCGLVNSESSKFCINCGVLLDTRLRCSHCGSDNPEGSLFCGECGESFSTNQKTTKGTLRKCKSCGLYNELDALFCVGCGNEAVQNPKNNSKLNPGGTSFKTIALFITLFFFTLLFAQKIATVIINKKASRGSPAYTSERISFNGVDEANVIAIARNFICACGGCGEQPLETCTCDMPRGSVEEKNFIREKLSEGLTVNQIIELVEKKYGYRIKSELGGE